MFSGGLDSTGVFWKLIQEKQSIHVHHMNLINQENRSDAEKVAVKNVCEYMKKFINFEYSESTHECPDIDGKFMWDSDMYNFMAGYICLMSNKINKVALGLTKTDLSSSDQKIKKRIERGTSILKCFANVEKIYPVVDMTKQQIYDMLPKDLSNITWSCRTPIYSDDGIKRCKRCKSCFELKNINTNL